MREFKFRGWHEGLPAKGSFKGVSAQMLFDEKIGDVFRWKSEGQPIKVMQFTGLQDKHGKDIYEGDKVLISKRGCPEDNEIGHIIFSSNCWCVDISPYYPNCREGWLCVISGSYSFTVIGNIHEQK